MNDIIEIIKLLEDSNVLIDSITETIKHQTKKQEGRFIPALLAPLVASLVQPVISSVIKVEEELEKQEEDIWIKIFSSAQSFKYCRDY